MNRFTMAVLFLAAATCMMAVLAPRADAAPPRKHANYLFRIRRPYLVDLDDPDSVLDVLSRLERSLMRGNDFEHPKRGVDFGLGRGYSGSQAAKHLMGLAAANYAVGPGRKRRDAVPSVMLQDRRLMPVAEASPSPPSADNEPAN